MQFGWFTYSILSALLIGLSMVFYKLPSFKGYSPFISTFYANGFSAILALAAALIWPIDGGMHISVFGILWGLLFAATMILQKILLKKIETNTLFPITSSISNVITILIGIVSLGEVLTLVQVIGVVVILWSIYLFSKRKADFPRVPEVFIIGGGLVAVSVFSKYIQKLAAVGEPIANLIIWQFAAASIGALAAAFIFESNTIKEVRYASRKYLAGSLLIGTLMFFGGFAILKALSMAPLSLVYSIHPIYFLVTAVAGSLIFKENLTRRKVLLILLAIAGVILIRIG